ncbi:MAG: hypothetical protein IJY24_03235 [Clostridia bacterium]|nr:hypothetical protein [Clostridia bacterium]
MKKLIALFLFIAILLSLASCGEPAPEPPATDDTPKDEGFEQGYKMEFVRLDEYGSIGIKELAAYADATPDIMAYRSEISSFDRTKIDSINFEIAYGTTHKGINAYSGFQSIPQFRIVLMHPENVDFNNRIKLVPYTLAEHSEELIDEAFTYNRTAFGDGEQMGSYGYTYKYNNSETVEIPIRFFSGERYGSFTLWACGENALDNNSLVYKYAADIFYLVDGDQVTLCSYHRFLKRTNGTDTTPEEAREMYVLENRIYSIGSGELEGFCRPLTMLANALYQDKIEFVLSFGWDYTSAFSTTSPSGFTELDCESFDIYAGGYNNKTVNEPFGMEKNTCIHEYPVIKRIPKYYRNQQIIAVDERSFTVEGRIPFGLDCCDEHSLGSFDINVDSLYNIYGRTIVFWYSHY